MDASRLRFMALWAINDALDLKELTEQLDELKASGLDGVVFHPRFYPDVPEYMSQAYLDIISDLILYAKSIHMSFWIYDENGWPSGTASGQVIARRPDLTCEWLEWNEASDSEHEVVVRSKHAVSSLDSEATELFIEITHEGYRKGLHKEAFAYVTGFFTDEVAFLDGHSVSVSQGAIPWSSGLPQMYYERFGEPLEPLLPLLFMDGECSGAFRTRYWELLTDALIEGFYKPIEHWCQENGKLFTGHLKGEENPFFQLSYSGSCFHVLKDLTMPAIDALERFPGNNFYPRIVHSLAMQQGRESCIVEAHGGSGWGVTPESFTNYVMWLASHGLEQFVLHLAQYRLKSKAVHDWPPSMPLHLTWRDAFPSVLAEIRRKVATLPDIRTAEPELLIVTPTRGVMAAFDPKEAMVINEHDGSDVPATASGVISNDFIALVEACHAAGIHYELTEERTIEEIGVFADGKVSIGKRDYKQVLLADGCVWNCDEAGRTSVDQMREVGVVIIEADQAQFIFTEVPAGKAVQAVPIVLEQSPWRAEMPSSNLYALYFKAGVGSALVAEVETSILPTSDSLTLILLDQAAKATVNGSVLEGTFIGGKYRYAISAGILNVGRIVVELEQVDGAEPNPVAFLEGPFTVRSLNDYCEKDDRQMMTTGPFCLVSPEQLDAGDLITSGLPFCASAARLTTTMQLNESIHDVSLQLTNVHADAANVLVGDRGYGWCFGPDWTMNLPEGLEEGEHEVTVWLVPNTYNVYGPHYHVDGDRHLVSPAQYQGIKNFADHDVAPELTLGDELHFVKWGMTGAVQLVPNGK
ncbi:hypothetical protein ACP8HI_13030 [Paenibacillus sp. FA6]|uniref:hypothetical protein n=1 Tax=Paenibacillus sp. FA6 TaxID=3413029 RepID=UPI003F65AD45